MTAEWIVYAAAVAALLGSGALALERALQLFSLPQRWAWAASISMSLLLPLAGPALAGRGSDTPLPVEADFPVLTAEALPMAPLPPVASQGTDWTQVLERALWSGWLLASLGVAGWLALSAVSLRRARRRWRRDSVNGSRVLVSGSTGPAVVGCFRGEIVLPEWVMGWDGERRRLIVEHEREHLRARDPLLLMGGWVALALAPWSPALWWQVHRLRAAVEVDCDRRVLSGSADVRGYGALLLEVGRRSVGGWLPAAAFSEPRHTLERRIRMITWKRPRNRVARAAAALAAVALVPVLLYAIPPVEAPVVARLGEMLPRPGVAEVPAEEHVTFLGIQEPAVLWLTGGNELRVGRPDARALRDDQLDAPLSALRRAAGETATLTFRVDTADIDKPGMGYSSIMAAQAACRAGFSAVIHEMVKRAPGTGGIRSLARHRQPLAAPCEDSGAPDTVPEVDVRPDTVPKAGFAYEVAVLDRKPELRNRADVARMLQTAYPPELQAAGIGGQTVMQFIIGATGSVDSSSVKVIQSSHEQFGPASTEIVKRMEFVPGLYRGTPVRVLIQMPVTWQPRDGAARRGAVEIRGTSQRAGASARQGEVYEVAQLDRKPELSNRNQVASLLQRLYPRMLHDAGIGGQTVMQFVIEADGKVDPSSARVIQTSHEQFGEASIKIVERMVFKPGLFGGRPVRTIIQMPITWDPTSPLPAETVQSDDGIRVRGSDAERPVADFRGLPRGSGAVRNSGAAASAEPAVLDPSWISGTIRDAAGRSVAGASIVIPEISRGAVSNAEGRFRLRVAPGSYSVHILAPGSRTPIIRSVTVAPTETEVLVVSIPPS